MFTRPDNSVYPSKIIPSDIDIAELAARISIDRLRRNGRAVFYDDFLLKDSWPSNFSGTSQFKIYSQFTVPGIEMKWSPYIPPGMMVFTIAPNESPYIVKNIPVIAHSIIGIELTIAWMNIGVFPTVLIEYQSNFKGFQTRWLSTTGYWQINNGSWINQLYMSPTLAWHNIKIVLDTINQRFLHLYVDRDDVVTNQNGLDATSEGLLLIQFNGDTSQTLYSAIDNVIITTDENAV